MLSGNTNGGHLYGQSKYAHFSQITESNKHLFPSFQKAKGEKCVLHKGDILYIPAGWWHWVKSYGHRCVSVNFWFQNTSAFQNKPFTSPGAVKGWPALHKWTDEYLIDKIDAHLDHGVWLWLDSFASRKRISIAEFIKTYSDRKEFAYLITAPDYDPHGEEGNSKIVKLLSDDITPPYPDDMKDWKANFWMNFGGIDTGLHFDDEDGFLCVVEGWKEVTLFAPQETQHLHPYPLQPIVLKPFHHTFFFNLYQQHPSQTCSVSSSELLSETTSRTPAVASFTKQLQEEFGVGKIVYSVKCEGGKPSWEFYFYGLDSTPGAVTKRANLFSHKKLNLTTYAKFHNKHFPTSPFDFSAIDRQGLMIFSIDVTEDGVLRGSIPCINLYYTPQNDILLPSCLVEKTFTGGKDITPRCTQVIDKYTTMFTNMQTFASYCLAVGIESQDIANIVAFLKKLSYKSVACALADKGDQVGIYMLGIEKEAFMNFLLAYDYPVSLILLIQSRLSDCQNLQFEVGFHFKKGDKTATPFRTAFYGLL